VKIAHQNAQSCRSRAPKRENNDNSLSYGTYDQTGANISVGGGLSMSAGNDFYAQGTQINAGSVSVSAGRDATITNALKGSFYESSSVRKQKTWWGLGSKTTTHITRNTDITNIETNWNAGNINANAGRDLTIVGGNFNAAGGINLGAGNNVNVMAAYDIKEKVSINAVKNNDFGRLMSTLSNGVDFSNIKGGAMNEKATDTSTTITDSTRIAKVTTLNGGAGGVNISAGNTINLEAPKISGSSLNVSAGNTNPDGKINLIAAIDSREVSRTVTSRNTFWQSNQSIGSLNQTLHMTNVNVPVGASNFQAAGGISVQLPKGAKLPQQIATLAKQPGNEYLTDLAKRSDIDWKQVEVINKTWDYKKSGITQETAIVVAIVVTIVTAGAASGAGMSLATSAGFATTTTAAGATVMATAGGAALAGATAAAITTLATQAAIAMLNNKGDIAGALKELGSKENVKGLATAVITAGLVQGLGVAFNLPTGAGTDTTILQKLQTNLINGVAGSLVSTAINGGSLEDSLKQAIKTAIISSVAASGAGLIGDLKAGDNPALNSFTGSLAHAILGCAVGSATAGNSSGCAAGAGGAVVGELSAEWYGKTFGGNPADAANFAKLTTAIAGLAGGANAMTIAGVTSNNAVQNNYLNHTDAAQREALKDKQRKGQTLTLQEQQTLNRLEILDIATDLALKDACKKQGDDCNAARRDLNGALSTYSGAGAMYDARLSPAANSAIFAGRDAAATLSSDPRLAQQTTGDAIAEFALPQVAGYAAGAVLGKFISTATSIYAARTAQSVNAANIQLAADELAAATTIGVTRADLGEHLTKAGVSRSGNIAGGHDAIAFDAALARAGGKIVSEVQTAPGIFQVEYTTAAGQTGTKTIYDPRMYPDMTNNASLAANKALIEFARTGDRNQTVAVNGVTFFVPVNVPKSGIPYVPTAYPTGVVK
jgi:filamentous hemagglutinin